MQRNTVGLTKLWRLGLVAVPVGLAIYVNSAMGWLVLSCTCIILAVLQNLLDTFEARVAAAVEYVVEIKPVNRQRDADAMEWRADEAERLAREAAQVIPDDPDVVEAQRASEAAWYAANEKAMEGKAWFPPRR